MLQVSLQIIKYNAWYKPYVSTKHALNESTMEAIIFTLIKDWNHQYAWITEYISVFNNKRFIFTKDREFCNFVVGKKLLTWNKK